MKDDKTLIKLAILLSSVYQVRFVMVGRDDDERDLFYFFFIFFVIFLLDRLNCTRHFNNVKIRPLLTLFHNILRFRFWNEQQQAAKMNATTTDMHTGIETSISLLNSGEHLDCITKQRAKGPTGRRLPRQAKSRLYPVTDAVQQQQRSESLPRLELQTANSDPVNIRLGHIKHATIIPGNRLINRMLELDNVDDEANVVAVSNSPDPPVSIAVLPADDDENNKQTTPDHSGFDQSWFLGSARASSSSAGLTSSSPPTELIGGGSELSDDVAQSKSSSTSGSLQNNQAGVTSRPANRYWSCNFL